MGEEDAVRVGGARPQIAAVCAVLAALLLASAPALAAGQRQHVFAFSFGSLGRGGGQFFHPTGVAVDDASGDVYVADRENNRVEEFAPVWKNGELVEETYVRRFPVPAPEAVAVDNCTEGGAKPCSDATDPSVGDVYVVGNSTKGNTEVYKFSPEGEAIGELTQFETKAKGSEAKLDGLVGVAVDPSGNLFAYQTGEGAGGISKIREFNDATSNEGLASVQSRAHGEATPGFAVDSDDDFYTGVAASTAEAGTNVALRQLLSELENDRVAVVAKLESVTGKVEVHELDYERSTAIAVNPENVASNEVDEENDVYVTNVADVAGEQQTTVAAFSPTEGEASEGEGEGRPIQRFGAPGLKEGDGIAVDAASGAVYVTDGASNDVDVFELEAPARPRVSSISANPVEGGAIRLSGQVSPTGSATSYHFEYGTASTVPSARRSVRRRPPPASPAKASAIGKQACS